MIRRIHPLGLLTAIICLLLTSCSILNPATEEVSSVLPLNTPIVQLTTIQLTVLPDTSVPYNTVGQNINFKYEVKNTGSAGIAGTVAVTGATVTCPALNTVNNLNDSLDPNEILICASVYPITQADLDRGSVTFVTTATLNGINSAPVTTTVPLVKPQVLTLTASANPTTYDQAGRQIIFTYVIKNSGSAPLGPSQFTISDTLISSAPFNCGDVNATIASNATLTCTATYTVSATDVNSVSITSIATASGGGAGPSQSANTTVNKGAVTQPNPANLVAGSAISHTVINGDWLWQIARCYGADPKKVIAANTQLANPAFITPGMIITVPNIGSNGPMYGTPCVVKHLVKAGDTWESIALLYNADPAILKIANLNTLTVGSEINIPRNSAGTTGVPSKALSLTITGSPTSYEQAGQQITYTYVIKNSGTTTLGPAQFTVSDNLISPTPFNCGAANISLAPNATATCTMIYTITQADMGSVSVTNIATASGAGVSPTQPATATINKAVRTLTLTTTANPTTYNQLAQQITFTYVIKNSGNVNLGPAQFTVTDSLISAAPINCGNADTSLAPNATVTCTATRAIIEADMNSASITSIATASGGGAGPSQPSNVTINKQ